jgi:hypothetical protein
MTAARPTARTRMARYQVAPHLLIATLLVLAQMLSASMQVRMLDSLTAQGGDVAAVLAAGSLCHAGDTGPQPAGRHDPTHDCALCPVCHMAATASVVTMPPTALPAPPSGSLGIAQLAPPAIGPPQQARATARPRGPPISVL